MPPRLDARSTPVPSAAALPVASVTATVTVVEEPRETVLDPSDTAVFAAAPGTKVTAAVPVTVEELAVTFALPATVEAMVTEAVPSARVVADTADKVPKLPEKLTGCPDIKLPEVSVITAVKVTADPFAICTF